MKHRAEAGSERVAQCEALANKLIANDSPHAEEISKRQEQLGLDYFFNAINIYFLSYFSLNFIFLNIHLLIFY